MTGSIAQPNPVDGRRLKLTQASTIKSQRPKWCWNERIPLGTLTIFAGRGGEGKSSFALYIAARINRGDLEGDLEGKPSPVLIISHEDDWGTVMIPRLKGAGADLDRIYSVSVETTIDAMTMETVPMFPIDLARVEAALKATGAKLMILDPIPSTFGGDHHKVTDVRRGLDPLAKLAQEMGIAIIGVMHFNKGSGSASDKLSGSHAFRDAVRSVMLFATDDETGNRVVTIDKSNYSQARGDSFAFNLVSESVYTDDGEQAEVGRVEYLGDTDLDVETIINRQPGGDEEALDRPLIQQHIYEYLFENGGSAEAKDVIKAGQVHGFKDAQIKKARLKMTDPKIVSQRQGFGQGAKYVWAIDSPIDSMDSRNPNPRIHGTHEESMGQPLARVTPIGGEK